MSVIFDTAQFTVRKLEWNDLEAIHLMQSDIRVMRYVRPTVLDQAGNKADLEQLITRYDAEGNDFWIYAVERKKDATFVGSVALVKTADGDDELGYRLRYEFWNLGYGSEIAQGLVDYCSRIGIQRLVAFVAYENKASQRIIEQLKFVYVGDVYAENLKLMERKYLLEL